MSVSFCGISFNEQSVPAIKAWQRKFQDVSRATFKPIVLGAVVALAARIFSLIFRQDPILSAFFASPYFLAPFGLAMTILVLSSIPAIFCQHIRNQIDLKGLQEEQ